MPTFCYVCTKCGHKLTYRKNEPLDCSRCHAPMRRDYQAEQVKPAYHPTKGR